MAEPKIPAMFKPLLPFIRRAEELDRDNTRPESKLIAYFCRQYAMELGIKLRANVSDNEATEFLLPLMDRLEDEKNKLPAFTQEEGQSICEDFALEIFSKADDEDRAGLADKNTARTFYAAGTFFDILTQFGEISPDIIEKRRYCKYKAATILKAIKEGQIPTPGGPTEGLGNTSDGAGATELQSVPSASSMSSVATSSFLSSPVAPPQADLYAATPRDTKPEQTLPDYKPATPSNRTEAASFPSFTMPTGNVGPSVTANHVSNDWNTVLPIPPSAPEMPPAAPSNHHHQQHQQHQHVPLVTPPPAPVPNPPPAPVPTANYSPQPVPTQSRTGPVTQNELNDAMECAKFAVAAMKVKDIDLAVQRLEMALRNLRGG